MVCWKYVAESWVFDNENSLYVSEMLYKSTGDQRTIGTCKVQWPYTSRTTHIKHIGLGLSESNPRVQDQIFSLRHRRLANWDLLADRILLLPNIRTYTDRIRRRLFLPHTQLCNKYLMMFRSRTIERALSMTLSVLTSPLCVSDPLLFFETRFQIPATRFFLIHPVTRYVKNYWTCIV